MHPGEHHYYRLLLCADGHVIKLYFSLSSLSSWAFQDGTFNYPEFYWSVVDIFKDGEGQGILDHFN